MAYNDRFYRFPRAYITVCAGCDTELGDTDEAVCSEACQEIVDLRREVLDYV